MGRERKGRTDGLAWGEGTIAPQPNGKWLARWWEPQPGGAKRKRGRVFDDYDAAQDHLRTIHRQIRDEQFAPTVTLTVRQIVEQWLERGKARWKPATHASYRQRAHKHVIPALGAIRADALTTPRVQHWVDGLVRAGMDAATIDGLHRVLNGALKEAVRIGIIDRNPATGTTRPPVLIRAVEHWTGAEVMRVLAAIGDDPMWRALYRLAVTTGMRPGELRALTWADIDLDKRVLVVKRTMTKDAAGLVVIGATTKTGRSRVNVLTESAVRDLAAWRTAQKARQLAAAVWHRNDLVFDRGDGRFLPQTTWQHYHDALIARTGVRAITLHGMRHTNATLDMEAGVHPKIVSERLGHRNIQTTLDRYSHVSLDLQKAAADALDRRLFGDDDPAAIAQK